MTDWSRRHLSDMARAEGLRLRIESTDVRLSKLREESAVTGAPPSLQASIQALEKLRAGLVSDLESRGAA